MKFLFTVLLCFFSSQTFCQKKSISVESLRLDTLKTKLSGVKFAYFILTDAERKIILQQLGNLGNTVDLQILNGIIDYLNKDLGIGHVITDEQEKLSYNSISSMCDYVYFNYSLGSFQSDFMAVGKIPYEFTFTFCDKSQYSFKRIIPVNGLTNYRTTFRNAMNSTVDKYVDRRNKWIYNEGNRLKINHNSIVITYEDFIKYLDSNVSKNKYEGVYELAYSNVGTSKNVFGIYNDNGEFKIVYFKGSYYYSDWLDGELKGKMQFTKSENDILVKYYNSLKYESNFFMKFNDQNSFDLYPFDKKEEVDRYIRIK